MFLDEVNTPQSLRSAPVYDASKQQVRQEREVGTSLHSCNDFQIPNGLFRCPSQ